MRLDPRAMTKSSIENAAKLLVLALVLTFFWTVSQVLGMIGLI